MPAEVTFGAWIKRRRKARDLTQNELARRVGCATSLIQKIEAGARRPSRQIATLLAEALDITHDQLPTFLDFARSNQATPPALRLPTNLPTPPTPLIGRDQDVAAVRARLLRDDTQLLTLIGPPGTGKTRLALAVAAAVNDYFDHGVCFVALAPVRDPELVAPTIVQGLDIQEFGGLSLAQRLINHLRERSMLLVLDNFEQVLAAAPLVAQLLAACPLMKILATSRAALRIRGERRYVVSPLALPPLSAHSREPSPTRSLASQASILGQSHPRSMAWERGPGGAGDLTQYAAMQLFADRAQAVRPDFTITATDAPAVAAICHRLDGLPLAIELVAARMQVLSPQALLERLGGRLLLETDGLRDTDERQRTLHGAIEWSYNLLTDEERALFARLAVFSGGCTLEAAEAVCDELKIVNEKLKKGLDSDTFSILEGLAALVDNSLLQRRDGPAGEPRFAMLETIHEYALGKLEDSGEAEAVRRRHAQFISQLMQDAEPWFNSDEQPVIFKRLAADHDNLRAALAWSASPRGDPELLVRLAGNWGFFWFVRGHVSEPWAWLEYALARRGAAEAASRAKLLLYAGLMCVHPARYAQMEELAGESLALYRDLNDRQRVGEALVYLSQAVGCRGDYGRAVLLAQEALAHARAVNDTAGIALSLMTQAAILRDQGDLEAAARLYSESLAAARAIADPWLTMSIIRGLGQVARMQSHHEQARAFLDQSLLLLRGTDSSWNVAETLIELGRLAHAEGDTERAITLYREGLARWRETGQKMSLVSGLEVLAAAHAQHLEGSRRAARLFGAADALRESLGAPLPPVERPSYERDVATIRARLGEDAFDTTWAEGRAMTLEQAIAYALEETEGNSATSIGTPFATL